MSRLSWSGNREAQRLADQAWQAARQSSARRAAVARKAKQRRKRRGKPRTYADYLRSPHWQDRRRKAIESAGSRCETCGSATRLEVHHLHYRTLGRERRQDLRVLCHECHAIAHESIGARDAMTERFVAIVRGFD